MKRTIRSSNITINPMFYIPEGVEDLEYEETFVDDDELDLSDDESEDGDGGTSTPAPKPKTPSKKKKKQSPKAPKKVPKKKPTKPKKKGGKFEPGSKEKIGTPKTLTIVSQKIMTKPDGSQVVDIIVDVDKIMKADTYEFRVTNKRTGKTTVIGG